MSAGWGELHAGGVTCMHCLGRVNSSSSRCRDDSHCKADEVGLPTASWEPAPRGKQQWYTIKHFGQWDGSGGKGTCCQAWLQSLGPTWWKERTDSYKLSSGLHTCSKVPAYYTSPHPKISAINIKKAIITHSIHNTQHLYTSPYMPYPYHKHYVQHTYYTNCTHKYHIIYIYTHTIHKLLAYHSQVAHTIHIHATCKLYTYPTHKYHT